MSDENAIPPEMTDGVDAGGDSASAAGNVTGAAGNSESTAGSAMSATEGGGEDELLLSQEEINAALGQPADARPEITLKTSEAEKPAAVTGGTSSIKGSKGDSVKSGMGSGAAKIGSSGADEPRATESGGWERTAAPLEVPEFDLIRGPGSASGIELLDDVELNVKIELGRAEMYVEDVLRLGVGSVVELNKLAGDPVDIFVNDRLIGRGEVLVLNDNFCVRINEILSPVPEAEK